MAKSKNWTMEDIVKKGITEVEPGIFRSSNHVSNTPSLFVVKGIVHGLNGSNGLLRSHWTKRKKVKEAITAIISCQVKGSHQGKVRVTYTGYKVSFMDWDNFCSSFKQIGDALVALKVIKDDNPSVIIEFIPKQIKSKRNEQRVEIFIEDVK